jgi:hypothetical protein
MTRKAAPLPDVPYEMAWLDNDSGAEALAVPAPAMALLRHSLCHGAVAPLSH